MFDLLKWFLRKLVSCHLYSKLIKLFINQKLLEENVLLKAVGGEVQEQYLALQRRLESNGLPSAPSPIPSVTDSDMSSIGPVRRGTVLRRPSRSSSIRSISADTSTFDKAFEPRCTTPDVLPRRTMSHVTSDTFTYASGQIVSNVVNGGDHFNFHDIPEPKPLQRSSNISAKEHSVNITDNGIVDPTVIAPCYMNPMDLRCTDTDDTMNRYTPPMGTQDDKQQLLPSVHQKTSPKASAPSNKHNSKPSQSKPSSSPRNNKRKAPIVPSKSTDTSLSSSTSSLTSSSSDSSNNNSKKKISHPKRDNVYNNLNEVHSNQAAYQERDNDPEYQNVPRRLIEFDDLAASEEGDYEQDMVVYEAITLGNDMIELVSRSTSSANSSKESSTKRPTTRKYKICNSSSNSSGSNKSNSSIDSYVKNKNRLNSEISSKLSDCDVSNVRKSVKHYENMVMTENYKLQLSETEKKENKSLSSVRNNENDFGMKSADSSLSLDSQDTVKENNLLNRSLDDRASPDGRNSAELEIVPSRQPQMPLKSRSNNSSQSSFEPIKLFEFDSPTETSDTETLIRLDKCPPSPRTIETESTCSFGFIQPDRNLRRRDTVIENRSKGITKTDGKGLKRSESFQAGDVSEANQSPKMLMRRRGSTDTVTDSFGDSNELYISGRTFTKYSPNDPFVSKEANELLTAALNRRQCRSVEDRLDQWLEEDLRRLNPENLKNKNKKRDSSRSSSSFEDNCTQAKSDKNNNKGKFLNNKKHSKNKNHQKRYSNSDLIAFNGFMNPASGFVEGDYAQNFMFNRPVAKRKTEFLGDKADFGLHEFPAQKLQEWNGDSRWQGIDAADPDIPTPDYVVTPAGTLTALIPTHHPLHILDMPSGLY